jgi:hypothetical protein
LYHQSKLNALNQKKDDAFLRIRQEEPKPNRDQELYLGLINQYNTYIGEISEREKLRNVFIGVGAAMFLGSIISFSF